MRRAQVIALINTLAQSKVTSNEIEVKAKEAETHQMHSSSPPPAGIIDDI